MNDNPAGRLVDWHTLAADEALAQLGSDAARLSQIVDGKWKIVSDYVKTTVDAR